MTTQTQAGAVKDDNGVLSFEWRPATGPFAGQTLTGGYQANHPQAGRGLSFTRHGNEAAFKAAKVKDAKVFIRAEGKPDVQELLAEYDRKDAERQAEYDRVREAARQADAALVADMRRKADEFRVAIPAGNVPVVLREKFRDSDGDPYYSYEADGVTLEGTEKDLMVHHGSAHAIRPGAINSFAAEHVYSIPRADLERVRAAQQARRAEKEGKDAARKAEAETRRRNAFAEAKAIGKPVVIRTWSESVDDPENENSLDIVSELAMPDGTVRVRRSPTH
jgi:hypothetical protein